MRRGAAALAVLLAGACGRGGARPGDAVTMHYELSVDGAARESTFGGAPVEVVQGRGDVPSGADAALLGMRPGEEKSLSLTPAAAFGERDESLVRRVPLESFGALASELKAGRKISGFRNGRPESGIVLSAGAGAVVVDFNHPLAGKTVGYRLRVVSIRR